MMFADRLLDRGEYPRIVADSARRGLSRLLHKQLLRMLR
jgi:hypothetical protein